MTRGGENGALGGGALLPTRGVRPDPQRQVAAQSQAAGGRTDGRLGLVAG